ncbi:MAG: MATE family efflux transporter [Candidatus Limiplasma sp.]|nr:MATE family efflux transporter [Candidatus Limiplasma sp.]
MLPIRTTHCDGDPLFSNRALVSLIVPLVIEQFLAILIGIVGTVMVSSISESAVSAISLVDSINVLLIQLFSAMCAGGAVVAAQYLGRREPLNASRAAKQLLYLSLFISLILCALSIAFCDPLLRLFFGNLSERTLAYCRDYFYLSALSYPALALYNGGAALLRAMGNSKASMWISLMMNLVNIAASALLIFGLRLEVLGAGVAALLARILGGVVITRLLLAPSGAIYISRPFHVELDKAMIGRIFSLGIPNGLENSMFQIGKLLVAGVVASFSISVVAANAVGNNIATMVNLPGTAIGLAMVTVVGQCMGARDIAQAKCYTIKLLKAAYALMFISNGALVFLAEPFVRAFQLSQEGVDAAIEVLRFHGISAMFFWPASFTLPNAMRAAGDVKFTMVVAILSMWIFRIALSYYLALPLGMGLMGVWVAMVVDWVARSVCFVWRYRSGKWLTHPVV